MTLSGGSALYLDVGSPEEGAEKMKGKRMNGCRRLIVPVPVVWMLVSQKVMLL